MNTKRATQTTDIIINQREIPREIEILSDQLNLLEVTITQYLATRVKSAIPQIEAAADDPRPIGRECLTPLGIAIQGFTARVKYLVKKVDEFVEDIQL